MNHTLLALVFKNKTNMLNINGPVYNYNEFINWVETLLNDGKTSGHRQTPELVGFTALNLKRMSRIFKTMVLNDDLKQLLDQMNEIQKWYVITEAWCGDSAQSFPALAKIAEASKGKILINVVLRDDNPEWMDKYHTNGAKSIPKMIAFNAQGEEIFTWGPRPKAAQELLFAWKANPEGKTWEEFEVELHTWYAKDKTQTLQHEITERLSQLV
jgi:hypothetical protein